MRVYRRRCPWYSRNWTHSSWQKKSPQRNVSGRLAWQLDCLVANQTSPFFVFLYPPSPYRRVLAQASVRAPDPDRLLRSKDSWVRKRQTTEANRKCPVPSWIEEVVNRQPCPVFYVIQPHISSPFSCSCPFYLHVQFKTQYVVFVQTIRAGAALFAGRTTEQGAAREEWHDHSVVGGGRPRTFVWLRGLQGSRHGSEMAR